MWHRLAIKKMPAVSFQCDGQKSCILGQHSFSLFLALAFLLLSSHCLICIFGPFVWLHCLIHLNVPPAHPSRFDTFYKHLLKGLSQASNWHHYPLIHPKRKRLLLQSAHGRKKTSETFDVASHVLPESFIWSSCSSSERQCLVAQSVFTNGVLSVFF